MKRPNQGYPYFLQKSLFPKCFAKPAYISTKSSPRNHIANEVLLSIRKLRKLIVPIDLTMWNSFSPNCM